MTFSELILFIFQAEGQAGLASHLPVPSVTFRGGALSPL